MTKPTACPECESLNWWQSENYQATDHNYLTWNEDQQRYNFSFELKATSDHEREPWFCSNDHEAPDEINEALDELI